jgi:hypothetical protein
MDELVNRVLPWDLTFTIDGQQYKVRPPTLADIDALVKFRANVNLSETEAAALFEPLFFEPRPKLAGLPFIKFKLIALLIIRSVEDYLKKENGEKLLQAAGLLPRTAADGTSGTSSAPSSSPAPASATP